jgi:hypothetical protein
MQNTEQIAQESYKGLDNKQIALVYYRFASYRKKLERFIESRMMPKDVNSPIGPVTMMVPAQESDIEEFTQSEYYTLVNSIVDTLQPVVELIEESDDSVRALQETFR